MVRKTFCFSRALIFLYLKDYGAEDKLTVLFMLFHLHSYKLYILLRQFNYVVILHGFDLFPVGRRGPSRRAFVFFHYKERKMRCVLICSFARGEELFFARECFVAQAEKYPFFFIFSERGKTVFRT